MCSIPRSVQVTIAGMAVRASSALALVLAACGSAPAPSTIANRDPTAAGPACPAAASPFPAETREPAVECLRGEPGPWLAGAASAPTCYTFERTGPTSTVEGVTLADGRRIWLWQGGCVHATYVLRGPMAAAVEPGDRGDVIRAGVELLQAANAVAVDDSIFLGDATQLGMAARQAPTGSFAIGVGGDATATVEPVGEDIEVTIDFPL